MEVWDLLRGQSCPVQTLQVTDTAVTSLEFDPAQQGQVGAEEAGGGAWDGTAGQDHLVWPSCVGGHASLGGSACHCSSQ